MRRIKNGELRKRREEYAAWLLTLSPQKYMAETHRLMSDIRRILRKKRPARGGR